MPVPVIAYIGAGAVGLYLLVKKLKGPPPEQKPFTVAVAPPAVAKQAIIDANNASPTQNPTTQKKVDAAVAQVVSAVRGLSDADISAKLAQAGSSIEGMSADMADAVGVSPQDFAAAAATLGLTANQLAFTNDDLTIRTALANVGLVLSN